MTATPRLHHLDKNNIPTGSPECRAVLVIRNEGLRLPYLLDYYRQLRVNRFFIVDNGSTDGGRDYLLNQPDCHVFLTHDSFAAAKCGTDWQQDIIDSFGEDHWWAMIDADELLVYPNSEHIPLPDFCRALETEGANGLYATMLDMYSNGPLSTAECVPGTPFTEICPFFDSDYRFQHRQKAPWARTPFPPLEPIGGPRLRVFYPEFLKGAAEVARVKVLRKMRDAAKHLGVTLNLPHTVPPMLFKIPLFKYTPGVKIISNHSISPLTLSQKTGALLHFKFFADFHARAMQEAKRGEHFDGGSEYARYLSVLEKNPQLSFYYPKSVRYTGTSQLASLALLKR